MVREAGSDADTHMADSADHAQPAAFLEATARRSARSDVLANNASMVCFLCRDEARLITGQTMHVNGGAFQSYYTSPAGKESSRGHHHRA